MKKKQRYEEGFCTMLYKHIKSQCQTYIQTVHNYETYFLLIWTWEKSIWNVIKQLLQVYMIYCYVFKNIQFFAIEGRLNNKLLPIILKNVIDNAELQILFFSITPSLNIKNSIVFINDLYFHKSICIIKYHFSLSYKSNFEIILIHS